jgi:hypothetical protein
MFEGRLVARPLCPPPATAASTAPPPPRPRGVLLRGLVLAALCGLKVGSRILRFGDGRPRLDAGCLRVGHSRLRLRRLSFVRSILGLAWRRRRHRPPRFGSERARSGFKLLLVFQVIAREDLGRRRGRCLRFRSFRSFRRLGRRDLGSGWLHAELMVALELLESRDRDVELVGDPGFRSALAEPQANLV